MTKLLILCYDFPPYVSVGGLRPYSWYKYLHLYDVYPIVVTRQWENKHGGKLDYISPGYSDSVEKEINPEGTVFKTPYKPNLANRILLKYGENRFKLIRKLITAYYEIFQFILPIGNKRDLYKTADEFLKNNRVDYIIASGDPYILFKYASELSKKHEIPWIADYRDVWVMDKRGNRLIKGLASIFEKKCLKNVHKITTVAGYIQKIIEQNIKNKEFEIIYNGYDPEIEKVIEGIDQFGDVLSIAFIGTINIWHPIEVFLRACNELLKENPDLKIRLSFFGINKPEEVKEMIAGDYQYLQQFAEFYPKMDNLELAKTIARYNAFLLFNDYYFPGTKIFDYIAIKRKILLCFENDKEANEIRKENYCLEEIKTESIKIQAGMISATNSGIIIKNAEHLKKVILELSKEMKEKGAIDCSSSNTRQYSRVKQVEKLSNIIND